MARDEFAIRREAASCENGCFRFRGEKRSEGLRGRKQTRGCRSSSPAMMVLIAPTLLWLFLLDDE